jgi:hypothetical protein
VALATKRAGAPLSLSETPTRQTTGPEGFVPFEDAHRDG